MPTDELEQALLEAKWGSTEEDMSEVIARLLDLPRAAVVRVRYAYHVLVQQKLGLNTPDFDAELPEDLRTAIKAQLRRGALRVIVREAIRDSRELFVHPGALIRDPRDVCNGCPFSIECVVESHSTPEKCFKGGVPARIDKREFGHVQLLHYKNGGAVVRAQRIRGDRVTVTCAHPHGTFEVDVGDIVP